MDEKICISSFYYTLLTVLIIMLAAVAIFQYSENKYKSCPVCPPCGNGGGNGGSNGGSNGGDMGVPPPLNPDDQDDLRLGELPPRRRDYRKMHDPLKEPTRRFVDYPGGYPGMIPHGNINIPTQGYLPSYQQMGYLSVTKSKKGEDEKQDPNKMLKLFGRRLDTYRYEYYVIHHIDDSLKIPLENKGDRELMEGDDIHVPGYSGSYKVHLYQFEGPKYIPYF